MRKHLIQLIFAAFSCCLASFSFGNITLVPLASGFSAPVDIASPNDGTPRMFIAEQGGRIRIVQNGFLLTTPFLNLSAPPIVSSGGERGLLGLAFHPQYASNGHFFVYFTGNSASGVATGDIVIARYTRDAANPNVADPTSRVNILTIPHASQSNHNGGSLRFGPDGFLYAGVGDGGGANDPLLAGQNRTTRLGKILRINVTGVPTYTVPLSNPYSGATCATTCPEIWAYGLRNPWRFSFDRLSGDFYVADVGQSNWEEVNRQAFNALGGANYGWNVCEGNHRFPIQSPDQACVPPANYVAPILEYSRSDGVSITGGYVYRGQGTPDLVGRYVFADFSAGRLWHTSVPAPAGKTPITTPSTGTLVSTFGEGATGELYMADYSNGTIYSFSSSTDIYPDPVVFTPVADAPINTLVTSHIIKITGLGANTSISINGAGGTYALGTANATTCSASFTASASTIGADATICVRHTSAATGTTTRTTTLTIGTTNINFVSTTVPAASVFDVTPSIVGNGFLSPMGVQQVQQGQTAFFTITPASGHSASVGGTCGGTLNGTNYTTNAITADCTVIATFTPITHAVTPSAGANGTISPNTVQNINQGATTTFTVTPNPGFSASVGGSCGGMLAGNTYTTNAITAACTVSASFALLPPDSPSMVTAIAGDTLIAVSFTVPAINSAAITHYVAQCVGTMVSYASALRSPAIVRGLSNGTNHTCTVSAVNAAGGSPPSAQVMAIPHAFHPVELLAVQSRKLHGGATVFDLPIDTLPPVTGPISIEPRMAGGGHRVVFQFNVPIDATSALIAEDAMGSALAGAESSISGDEVIVNLTGIADGQRARLAFAGVGASNTSSVPNVSASVGFLIGDVNSSRSVNASDISALKSRAGQVLNLSNARFDLNASGAIDNADIAAAKARAGLAMP